MKLINQAFILICSLATVFLSEAGEKREINEVIQSKATNEKRVATVVLPKGYQEQSEKRYPVVYRLDGKGNISFLSPVLDKMQQFGAAPDVILVTVENVDRTRDLAPTVNMDPRGPVGQGGGADKMLDYIETELMPLIDKKYRTHDYNVLAGASLAGLFALHTLQSRPHLFDAYITYSPAVWWGDRTTVKRFKQFLSNTKSLNKYLYINIGAESGELREVYDEFVSYVQQNKPQDFHLVAEVFDGVNHSLTSNAGLFNAYQQLFLPLQMPLDKLTNGVESVKAYYQQLSRQWGIDNPPEYVLREIGYQLGDRDEHTAAVEVFKYNIERNPKMSEPYNGLAYGYERQGMHKQALEQVTLAIGNAKPEHPDLAFYQQRKVRLIKLLGK